MISKSWSRRMAPVVVPTELGPVVVTDADADGREPHAVDRPGTREGREEGQTGGAEEARRPPPRADGLRPVPLGLDQGPEPSRQQRHQGDRDQGRRREGKEAAVCFDTDLLRVSAGWTGGFLKLYGTPFDGSHGSWPEIKGTQVFGTKQGPGWANKAGDFKDPRSEPFGPLPADWAKYKGLYRSGDQRRDLVHRRRRLRSGDARSRGRGHREPGHHPDASTSARRPGR